MNQSTPLAQALQQTWLTLTLRRKRVLSVEDNGVVRS